MIRSTYPGNPRRRLWLAALVAGLTAPAVGLAKATKKPADAAAPGDESPDPYGEAQPQQARPTDEGAPVDVLDGDPFTPGEDAEPDAPAARPEPKLNVGEGLRDAVDTGAGIQGNVVPDFGDEGKQAHHKTANKKKARKHVDIQITDTTDAKRAALAKKAAEAHGPKYSLHEVGQDLQPGGGAISGAVLFVDDALKAKSLPVWEADPNGATVPRELAGGVRRGNASGRTEGHPTPAEGVQPQLAAEEQPQLAGGVPPSAAGGVQRGNASGRTEGHPITNGEDLGRNDGGPIIIADDTSGMIGGVPTSNATSFASDSASAPAATMQDKVSDFDPTPALAGANTAPAATYAPQDREDDAAMALFGDNGAVRASENADGHDGAMAAIGGDAFSGGVVDDPLDQGPGQPAARRPDRQSGDASLAQNSGQAIDASTRPQGGGTTLAQNVGSSDPASGSAAPVSKKSRASHESTAPRPQETNPASVQTASNGAPNGEDIVIPYAMPHAKGTRTAGAASDSSNATITEARAAATHPDYSRMTGAPLAGPGAKTEPAAMAALDAPGLVPPVARDQGTPAARNPANLSSYNAADTTPRPSKSHRDADDNAALAALSAPGQAAVAHDPEDAAPGDVDATSGRSNRSADANDGADAVASANLLNAFDGTSPADDRDEPGIAAGKTRTAVSHRAANQGSVVAGSAGASGFSVGAGAPEGALVDGLPSDQGPSRSAVAAPLQSQSHAAVTQTKTQHQAAALPAAAVQRTTATASNLEQHKGSSTTVAEHGKKHRHAPSKTTVAGATPVPPAVLLAARDTNDVRAASLAGAVGDQPATSPNSVAAIACALAGLAALGGAATLYRKSHSPGKGGRRSTRKRKRRS